VRNLADKILPRDQAAAICQRLRSEGRRIGFTSGAFDLLHAGHADYLQRARALCDALVVGVNSDESVRRYKGPGRPIVGERERAELVAALESVDYVFLFSERRNAANIELLQPHLYIKAGDYEPSGLTSAETLERQGGHVVLLDIRHDLSTTALIKRIRAAAAQGPPSAIDAPSTTEKDPTTAASLDAKPRKTAPAVFLDRDGTINEEIEYLHEPDRFRLLPGAAEGMRRFADMGYRIVVVTNQAGIALGYFTKEDFYHVNRAMFRALQPYGVVIDRIYFCPHGKTDSCACRKPGTALFERAAGDLNLDLAHSVAIGDKTADLEAGRRLGLTTILVTTGHAGRDREYDVRPDHVAAGLLDAAQWVLDRERQTPGPEAAPEVP